jgi:PiT family inorganic phosphate transporter
MIFDYSTLPLILAIICGFVMACGVGANDVANAMGTSVGSKVLTVKQAILIAIFFEFAGALLAGGSVVNTIQNSIINANYQLLVDNSNLIVYGMLASLLSSGLWLLIATAYGWPVSTTHSIIGAIVGFAVVGVSPNAVNWKNLSYIASFWVFSPVVSAVIAFLVFTTVNKLILDTENPFAQAKKYMPVYMFITGFIISSVTLLKGLKHLGILLNFWQSLLLPIAIGLLFSLLGFLCLYNVRQDKQADQKFQFSSVEKIFGVMMVFTACTMAFAHGSNDVANAVGPLAAIANIHKDKLPLIMANNPSWILLLGALGIVFGLVVLGYKIIKTVGSNITALTPSRGFAAELATAATVSAATGAGIPVSTTHVLVGAILGVGIARGIGALNLRVLGTIILSWFITLPAGGLLSIIFFYLFKVLFS